MLCLSSISSNTPKPWGSLLHLLALRMAKTCQNVFVWWKIPLCSSLFSALPGSALKLPAVLKCISILFPTPVQQSDAFPLYSTRSNAFSFLCLSLLSPLWSLRCFSVLLLVGQGAFGSISGLSPCVTPHPQCLQTPVPLLTFPDKTGFLCLSFMKWLMKGKGWGHLFPSAAKPVGASVSLWRSERQNHPSSLGWLAPLHISFYPWSLFLRSSKY